MKIYNTFYNLQLAKFDSISKFNLLNFNKLFKVKKLNVLIPLSTSESNFLKNFMIIIKVFKELFNRKPTIFLVKKNFQRGNKFRNNLIFSIGATFRNKDIFINLDYIYNIIIPLTKKINGNIIFDNIFKNMYIIKFFSLNQLLGISNYNYHNIALEFNYNISYNNISKNLKLNKFYEKIFL